MLNGYILCWVPLHFNFAIPCETNILHFCAHFTVEETDGQGHVRSHVRACSVAQSCSTLLTTWTIAHKALLSMGFCRKEYWSGLPFTSPGDLPNPGIKPKSPESPTFVGRFFITEPPGSLSEAIESFRAHSGNSDDTLSVNAGESVGLWGFSPLRSDHAAAAAAKSLQSCPTLWDSIEGSPSGSLVPGILQARTLECVAISFSNAWKWKVKVKSLSRVQLFETPWTAAYQAPPSMGFSRQEYWSGVPLPSPSDHSQAVLSSLQLSSESLHLSLQEIFGVFHLTLLEYRYS